MPVMVEWMYLYIIMLTSMTMKMSVYAHVPSATNCCMTGPLPQPCLTASKNLYIVSVKRMVSKMSETILFSTSRGHQDACFYDWLNDRTYQ